jgi:16S rRNA (uracil1498-N3)-methyltransferase|tara:strand:- start:4437 stop:5171 length:735 start_codon:yes stop_codon:yes gene_type:complete
MLRIYYQDEIKNIIEINNSRFHKISKVLRMSEGEKIELFDGNGLSFITKIISISKEKVILENISKSHIESNNKSPEIHLAFSIIKPSRFEIAVEKTTEIGINKILPLITEHTNKTLVKRFNSSRLERLKNISISAAEQCGTNFVPQINNPILLNNLIDQYNDPDILKIMFYEDSNITDLIKEKIYNFKKILLIIGPEGGFTKDEYMKLKINNYRVQSLGKNILRAETAAICAVNNINYFLHITQ